MSEIGKLADDLFRAKQLKSELNKELTKLNADIKEIEAQLLAEMEEQNLYKLGTDAGMIYKSRQVMPHVVDWDVFTAYIREYDYFHLLQRRPTLSAYRELYEQGIQVPGVEPLVFDEVRTRKS